MSFFELNYKGLILNVLQLTCLLIDGDIESNPGPMQNYKSCKSPCGRPEKIIIMFLKECQKIIILVRRLMLILLVVQSYKMFFFFNTIQPVSLNIISHGQLLALTLWNHCKIWNLRFFFKKKNDINFNVCFCQGNTTKINIDTIVNVANETLVVGKH